MPLLFMNGVGYPLALWDFGKSSTAQFLTGNILLKLKYGKLWVGASINLTSDLLPHDSSSLTDSNAAI